MDLVFPPRRIRKHVIIEAYPSRVFSTDEFCNFEQKCVSFFEDSVVGSMRLMVLGLATTAVTSMTTIQTCLWIGASKVIPPVVFVKRLHFFGNVP